MAEGDDGLTQFLENESSLDGVDFQAASGVNWSGVGMGVVGSVVAALAIAFNTIIQSTFEGAAALLTGLQEFVAGRLTLVVRGVEDAEFVYEGGVIGALFGGIDTALAEAYASVGTFGFLSYPIAVGATIASFYVASWARQEVFGE